MAKKDDVVFKWVEVSSVSAGASVNSDALPVDFANQTFSVQVLMTGGTPAGTYKLQSSHDGTNWDDIPGATATITGAGSNTLKLQLGVPGPLVRLVWTRTSGTSTLSAKAVIWGVGDT